MNNQKVYIIAGPTASGKSGYALTLAQQMDGVIINVDSLQVYKELPKLTAQPDDDARKIIPHRLYGVFSHSEKCNAGIWLELASKEIETCFAKKQVPVIVGGTGLYLKALTEGLRDIPEIEAQIKDSIDDEFKRQGIEACYARLCKIDPDYAKQVAAQNTQRILRALAVYDGTGRRYSEWQKTGNIKPYAYHFHKIGLFPDRDILYERCNKRFLTMMEQGIIEEVEAARKLNIPQDHTLAKAIGYMELCAYLDGEITREEAVLKSQQRTRNYAKRQVTWFKHQMEIDQYV